MERRLIVMLMLFLVGCSMDKPKQELPNDDDKITDVDKTDQSDESVSVKEDKFPVFEGSNEVIVEWNEKDNWISYVTLTAKDEQEGDLTEQILCNPIPIGNSGDYTSVCWVSDSEGNTAETDVLIHVNEKTNDDYIIYEDGIIDGLSIDPLIVDNPAAMDVIVNKFRALPDDYAPNDLVELTTSPNHYLRSEAASACDAMINQAIADGYDLRVLSSYRTKDYQTNLFNNYYNAQGAYYAAIYSAVPRRSEHELGLAVDVGNSPYLDETLYLQPEGIWLNEHAHEFGFTMRYPFERILDTQYGFEPWHFRYVGVEKATQLKENNQILEDLLK